MKNDHNFNLSGKVRKYQGSVFSQNYVSHYFPALNIYHILKTLVVML